MTSVKSLTIDDIKKELRFTFSRSSGPGGQHVNKVNTKVTLIWDILNSATSNEDQKKLLLQKLKTKLTGEGVLIISSQSGRSQLGNKRTAIQKLEELLDKSFFLRKKRKSTKPTKASVLKRLEEKKKQGEKKRNRKGPDDV